MPGAEIDVVSGAGHMLVNERPAYVAERVTAFLLA